MSYEGWILELKEIYEALPISIITIRLDHKNNKQVNTMHSNGICSCRKLPCSLKKIRVNITSAMIPCRVSQVDKQNNGHHR